MNVFYPYDKACNENIHYIAIMLVKYLLFTILSISVTCLSCKNKAVQKPFEYAGVLTGLDSDSCGKAYTVTLYKGNGTYRFYHFPPGTYIDSAKFPTRVLLNFIPDKTCGKNKFIHIQNLMIKYRDMSGMPM